MTTAESPQSRRRNLRLLAAVCSLCTMFSGEFALAGGRKSEKTLSREYYDARALFEKIWAAGEPSAGGGDGLGPLFNHSSCVACHNLAGTGGAGSNEGNVTILSAASVAPVLGRRPVIFQGELEEFHPGFRNRTSILLHKHATTNGEEKRLEEMRQYRFIQTRDDFLRLDGSERSTPALFGAGLIDAISDKIVLEAEAREFPRFPEIKGRVSRLRDGRIGKFGWKGQTGSLQEFVLAACSNELGLKVPGRRQASLASAKEFDPKTVVPDLTDEECKLLVRFVANLPAPVVRSKGAAARGRVVFEAIGCAACHAPSLGNVRGLYSDLLLHDLGERFRALGAGYGGPTRIVDASKEKPGVQTSGEASPTEWRTTPLWGVADSAPYLHDGRAATLDEAILLHGGEAGATSKRYAGLAFDDRQALLAFLHSQVAPDQPGRPAHPSARTSSGKSK